MRAFVIADPHFGHRKIAEFRAFSSVEEHDAHLVEAWNRRVGKRDTVYVLGDLFDDTVFPRLNGVKKLAPGNHDTRPMRRYLENFSQVRAYFEYDGALLSHIPVHPAQLENRWDVNVHGHLHAALVPDDRYLNVSVEQLPFYAPAVLDEVLRDRRSVLERIRLQGSP